MMNSYSNTYISFLLLVFSIISVTNSNIYAQSTPEHVQDFIAFFPEDNLPYSISENELVNIDKSELKLISSEFNHFFLDLNTSKQYKNYALSAIEIENGTMIFHLEEIEVPIQRNVYATILSETGLPESSVLFAAYEAGVNEVFTYAVINNSKLIHRTIKSFDRSSNKVNIKTEKFRLNTIGEIVAL